MTIKDLEPAPDYFIGLLEINETKEGIYYSGENIFSDYVKVIKINKSSDTEHFDVRPGDYVLLEKFNGKRIEENDEIYIISNLYNVIAYESRDK